MNDGYKTYASQEWVNENNPIKIINKSCHIADLDIGTYIIESNLFDDPDAGELIKVTLANINEEDQPEDNFWEIYSGTLTINDRYEEETDEYIRVVTSFIANGNMNTPDWITLSEMQDDEGNIYMESEICSIKNANNVEMFMLISTKFKIEQENGVEIGKWYSKLDNYWIHPSSNIPASALVEVIDENNSRFKVPTAKAVYNFGQTLQADLVAGDFIEIKDGVISSTLGKLAEVEKYIELISLDNVDISYDDEANVYYGSTTFYGYDSIITPKDGDKVDIEVVLADSTEAMIFNNVNVVGYNEGEELHATYNFVYDEDTYLFGKEDDSLFSINIIWKWNNKEGCWDIEVNSVDNIIDASIKVFGKSIKTDNIKLPNEALSFDDVPTKDSKNLITSGNVYEAIQNAPQAYIVTATASDVASFNKLIENKGSGLTAISHTVDQILQLVNSGKYVILNLNVGEPQPFTLQYSHGTAFIGLIYYNYQWVRVIAKITNSNSTVSTIVEYPVQNSLNTEDEKYPVSGKAVYDYVNSVISSINPLTDNGKVLKVVDGKAQWEME